VLFIFLFGWDSAKNIEPDQDLRVETVIVKSRGAHFHGPPCS